MESHTPTDITRLGPGQVFHSAEHVAFDVPIAGPTSRILAYGIDAICVGLITVGLGAAAIFLLAPAADWIADWLRPIAEPQQGDTEQQAQLLLYVFAALVLMQFAVEWVYFIILELVTGGRSIGKAIIGLRVTLDGGLPVTPTATAVRNILRLVDVLPIYYLTGLTSMVISREGKRLGDYAAGTIVIRLDHPPPAPPLPLLDDADAEFRFERSQIAAMGADERALLRQTLRRLDALPPAQRADVVQRTAEVLRQRVGYREIRDDEAERFLVALVSAL